MSSSTVTYVVRLTVLAVHYCILTDRRSLDTWPDYVRGELNIRHPHEVPSLFNWTYDVYAVTVPSRRDLAAGLDVLVRRRSETFTHHTKHLHTDALGWHVYIEDCKLRARPIWYKPPGRNLGFYLGEDPIQDVLNYYERRGRQVLRALDNELEGWKGLQ